MYDVKGSVSGCRFFQNLLQPRPVGAVEMYSVGIVMDKCVSARFRAVFTILAEYRIGADVASVVSGDVASSSVETAYMVVVPVARAVNDNANIRTRTII